ncbi:MAG TPA: 16S rRNA (uracil(1498)-N(3))-methyltransferase [Thiothrix sp.]|nr:16S rRNA (uracil(1498)-N(3))-methyltransferase [Thiothrix sp.]
MRIPRFFQADSFSVNQSIELSPLNYRHAIQVLRLKITNPLILFNGTGGEYHAYIIEVTKKQANVMVERFDAIERESPLQTTLALALIKPEKMDYALQKAVELGVTHIQPLITERSVIRLKANQLEKKLNRWQGIITSACEQSGRTRLPQLHSPIPLNAYLQHESQRNTLHTLRISMLPNAAQSLTTLQQPNLKTAIQLIIGPEGGFTDAEEVLLRQAGTTAISFGSRILRAETAALVGLTALQMQWGDY